MTKQLIEKLISEQENLLKEYRARVETSMITSTPFIVKLGEIMTAGCDDEGRVIALNKSWPWEFSKEGVKTICAMDWKDGLGRKITAKAIGVKQWYLEQIQFVEQNLINLKSV